MKSGWQGLSWWLLACAIWFQIIRPNLSRCAQKCDSCRTKKAMPSEISVKFLSSALSCVSSCSRREKKRFCRSCTSGAKQGSVSALLTKQLII